LKMALRPGAVIMVDSVDGGTIARFPTGASFVERFKRPYVVIHREDLHRILLDACSALQNVEMIADTSVVSCEELGRGVRLHTKDGRSVEGAALIGADGLRSVIRQQMRNEG